MDIDREVFVALSKKEIFPYTQKRAFICLNIDEKEPCKDETHIAYSRPSGTSRPYRKYLRRIYVLNIKHQECPGKAQENDRAMPVGPSGVVQAFLLIHQVGTVQMG